MGRRVKRKVLEVTWRDSVTSNGKPWLSEDEALEWAQGDIILTTVGYKITEDGKNLTIASSRSKDGDHVGGLWSIPIGSIIKRRILHGGQTKA
jgi:hypothetical protein